MSNVLAELVEQLALERIEENLFRGQSQDLGWGAVFGGQVLGQALSAAVQTVPPERHAHSLHAYFLRSGDVAKPIVYDVDRIRDGSSFTTRRVVAIQSGRPIFNLSCSFQKQEPGFTHQDPMPETPPPESLTGDHERFAELARTGHPSGLKLDVEIMNRGRPFELRTVNHFDHATAPSPQPAKRKIWLRAVDALPDSPALHAYLLAYASDYSFVTTALLPHGVTWYTPGMQVASIDHVMWFHRPFRVDEWLLYVIDSPSASGARGLVRGSIYTRDGVLVASTAQEGLMRMREPSSRPPA
ncbi:MAG: Acyl-CoA thioesterase [Myxococcaceae bacterium]|nr:Acyl-CoA thioesterase [Myxococcaceae bacterium]